MRQDVRFVVALLAALIPPAWTQDGAEIGTTPATQPASRTSAGSDIAFMRGGVVWCIDADGSGERRLTDEAWYDRPLVWLPDGSKVLYWGHDAGWNIWSVDVNDGAVAKLTRGESKDNRSAVPSPDGSKIAYMSSDPPGLWLMNADGSEPRRLSERGHRDAPPAWSPDGKAVVYVDISASSASLYRVTPADGADTLIGRGDAPAFTPDGRHLWLVSGQAGSLDIWQCDASGQARRQLTRHPESETAPTPSPDGKTLAYLRHLDAQTEVRGLTDDGATDSLVATLDGEAFSLSWNPQSSRLVVSAGSRREPRLFILDLKTRTARRVTDGVAAYAVWRPRGSRK